MDTTWQKKPFRKSGKSIKVQSVRGPDKRVFDRLRGSPATSNKTMKQTDETVARKRDQYMAAWRQFGAEAVFANLTLAQFEVESEKPLEVRERIRVLRTQLRGLKLERDQADAVWTALMVSVANSVRGNPDYGMDSAMYRALGFVPKSERRSGLARKRKAADSGALPETDAA